MGDLRQTRNILIAIINQHLGGITSHKLEEEYKREENERIPFARYGYLTLNSFVESEINDAIECKKFGYQNVFFPLATPHSKHILDMKRGEIKSKKETDYRTMLNYCNPRNKNTPIRMYSDDPEPAPRKLDLDERYRFLNAFMRKKTNIAPAEKGDSQTQKETQNVPSSIDGFDRSRQLNNLSKSFSEMCRMPRIQPTQIQSIAEAGAGDGENNHFDIGPRDALTHLRSVSQCNVNVDSKERKQLEFVYNGYVSDIEKSQTESETSMDIFCREISLKEEPLQFPQCIGEKLATNTMRGVRISDVNAPSKFWIQLQEYDDEMNKLSSELNKFYRNNNDPEYMVKWGQIEIGEYYVVTVNDNWRRATLEAISDNQLKMRFIDSGTLLPMVNIGNVRVLDERFQKTPILCVACTLSNIQPIYRAYTVESAEYFLNLVSNRSFFARINDIIRMRKGLKISVELTDKLTKACINREMIEAKHANASE